MERIVFTTVRDVLTDLRWQVFVFEGGEIEIQVYSELALVIKSALLKDLMEVAERDE